MFRDEWSMDGGGEHAFSKVSPCKGGFRDAYGEWLKMLTSVVDLFGVLCKDINCVYRKKC